MRIDLICNRHGACEHRKTGNKQPRYKCVHCEYDCSRKYLQGLRERARAYAGGCCQLCGYDKCTRALHFHHIDPTTKLFAILENRPGKPIARSWDKLKPEIDKCILVCMNCHMEAHTSPQHVPQEKIYNLDRTRLSIINKRIIEWKITIKNAIDSL